MSVDLKTDYLGIELANPLVVAACPLTGKLDSALALQAAGASAIVLPSLFEEQIEHDEQAIHNLREFATLTGFEASSYLPDFEEVRVGPEAADCPGGHFLDCIHRFTEMFGQFRIANSHHLR